MGLTAMTDFKQNVFQGRSVLAEKDFTAEELEYLIDFGLHLKDLKKNNIPHKYLEGKNIALLFEKSSTRTRAAFVTASHDLGAHPDFLDQVIFTWVRRNNLRYR